MFKKSTCWLVLCYGLLLAILGFVGYYNSCSKPSLIMGCGFGVLLIVSSWLLFMKNKVGVYSSIISTALLATTFAIRYRATGKPIPALLAIVSAAMLIFFIIELSKKKR